MKFSYTPLIVLLLAAPLVRAADCFNDTIRITALVRQAGKAKVGIVELANTNSAFVAVGGKMAGIEIVSIDYEKEVVTMKRGDTLCILSLAADPNAPKGPMIAAGGARGPDSPDWRGEAIEKFLRENPDAMKDGDIKLAELEPEPEVKGFGPSIDAILAQNPELARKMEKPTEGKGEGIENFLKANGLKVDDAPIPEGSLGPGIEEAMKKAGLVIENNPPPVDEPPPELVPAKP